MGGINHQTWGALLFFYHYSHEQKLTAVQAGFQWPWLRILDWRYLPYIRPIFQAYEIWYSTSILGSWRSPIEDYYRTTAMGIVLSLSLSLSIAICQGCRKYSCTSKWRVYKGKSHENGWFGGTSHGFSHKTVPKHTARVTTVPHLWPLQPTKRTKCRLPCLGRAARTGVTLNTVW